MKSNGEHLITQAGNPYASAASDTQNFRSILLSKKENYDIVKILLYTLQGLSRIRVEVGLKCQGRHTVFGSKWEFSDTNYFLVVEAKRQIIIH